MRALRRRRSSPDAQARHVWQYHAIQWGQKLGYPSLRCEVSTKEGGKAWQSLVKDASEDTVIRLVIAAERKPS